jgi:cytochrome c oxidase subunit 2
MKPALLVIIGLVLGAVVAVAIIVAPILPDEASEQAGNIDAIYFYMVAICGLIFGVVTVVLVYCIFAFRGKPGDLSDGPPIHGITWLEVVWTLIPTAIVASIVVASWIVLNRNDDSEAADRINVHIEGFQFGWNYDYTDEEYGLTDLDELVLPVGKPVRFELTTKDVIHSWWVPDWRLQMNTTPGQTNILSVTPKETGDHELVCAFLCGIGHAAMNSEVGQTSLIKRVRVVTEAEFEQWMTEQKAKAEEAASQPGAEGVAVFNSNGCGACHALAAAGSSGNLGPALDPQKLAADAEAAGEPLEDYIRESILDPNAKIAEGFPPAMPNNFGDMPPEELDQLVALLSGAGAEAGQ